MLESRRLKHFLTVYELGSIGQASEKLLLTQPALSKSIRSLEDVLGVRLFDRTSLGVVPTVFGKALALHAKAIQAQVRHAEAEIASLRGTGKGQVAIGVGPSIANMLMPLVTRRIRERGLDLELSVTEGLVDDLVPALRRGEIDFAVGSWPPVNEPALTTEVIARDSIRVYVRAGHPLLEGRVEMAELLDHPWALPPSSQRWRQQLQECFYAQGLSPPKPAVVTNSATYLKALVREQDYLSFLPGLLVAGENVGALDVGLPEFKADIGLSYKERSLLNPGCRELAELLRETGAELSARPDPASLTEAA